MLNDPVRRLGGSRTSSLFGFLMQINDKFHMGSLLHKLNNCCSNCGQAKQEQPVWSLWQPSFRKISEQATFACLSPSAVASITAKKQKETSYLRGTNLESNTRPLQFQSEQRFFKHLGLGWVPLNRGLSLAPLLWAWCRMKLSMLLKAAVLLYF